MDIITVQLGGSGTHTTPTAPARAIATTSPSTMALERELEMARAELAKLHANNGGVVSDGHGL